MDIRQPGERWEFRLFDSHYMAEVLSNGDGKVIYLYPDHDSWRKVGDTFTPSWNEDNGSYKEGFWKHLPGQQAPKGM